jgi:RNA polymerase sigma-70 factor (ECF subfamily)
MSELNMMLTAHDERVFTKKMAATYRKVFSLAYRLSGSRTDAEDLTQEAFVRAFRSFSDYEGDKPFENWIYRIVTRLFLDLRRSRKRRVQTMSYDATWNGENEDAVAFQIPDETMSPERDLYDRTFSEDVERVMNLLSPEQRLLVTLADVEGMPHKDIADIIGSPVGTIRSRLHRMHKFLREQLAARQPQPAWQS